MVEVSLGFRLSRANDGRPLLFFPADVVLESWWCCFGSMRFEPLRIKSRVLLWLFFRLELLSASSSLLVFCGSSSFFLSVSLFMRTEPLLLLAGLDLDRESKGGEADEPLPPAVELLLEAEGREGRTAGMAMGLHSEV